MYPVQPLEALRAALWLAASSFPDPKVSRYCRQHEIDLTHVNETIGPICCHRMSFTSNSARFEPTGMTGLVCIVHDQDCVWPIDLLGRSMHRPEQFGVFLQQAEVLGIDHLLNPATYYGGHPCPLWRTPLRWLQHRCTGATLLTDRGARLLNEAPGHLAAEDIHHARQLIAVGVSRQKLVIPAENHIS